MQAFATQALVTTHSPTIASACSPTDLLIVRNDNGSLSGVPLLREPLTNSTPNAIRQLLLGDRPQLVDALMHEHVLAPEGKSDFLWFSRLARILEITSNRHPAGVDFAVKIGVVPTHGSIGQTSEFLAARHPHVACLVDGDAEGYRHADQLKGLTHAISLIVSWPKDWTIENVIVWILEADPDVLQDSLLREAGVPSTMEELTSAFAVTGGQARLKSNYLAHDALADALATSDPCLARANTLLSDMVKILTSGGSGAKYFQRDDAGSTTTSIVWNFHPTGG